MRVSFREKSWDSRPGAAAAKTCCSRLFELAVARDPSNEALRSPSRAGIIKPVSEG